MNTENQQKVLHLNNVADTAQNLVSYAKQSGKPWALRPLPNGSLASPKQWFSRGKDLWQWQLTRSQADILHIHYAPNGYYRLGKKTPNVLHIHGSDLRLDANKFGVGSLVKNSIAGADAVIAATPDLLAPLQELRPDAFYVENAVPATLLDREISEPVARRVIFNSRWDESKGGAKLVQAAADLVAAGIEVYGLDWGNLAGAAQAQGVKLVPRMSKKEFHDFLSTGQVHIGQFAENLLTISDLESLALGRTLIAGAALQNTPVVYSPLADLAEVVTKELKNDPINATNRRWVIENRHPEKTIAKLEEIYHKIS